MADVTMPRLSDTMEEGKILRWLKRAGERVEAGELLVEVETDKADMEVESSASGVVKELRLAEGETAAVGTVIAVIEAGGTGGGAPAGNGAPVETSPGVMPAAKAATVAAAPAPREASSSPKAASKPTPSPATTAPKAEPRASVRPRTSPSAPSAATSARPAATHNGEVKASPLARSLAEELGIDLATIRGTGPAGRITRRDVEDAQQRAGGRASDAATSTVAAGDGHADDAAARRGETGHKSPRAGASEPARTPSPSADEPGAPAADGIRRVPLTKMRASIAKRMSDSKREAPHFYLTTVVDMDEAVRLRAQLKSLGVEPAVTYNHMVLKACADALAHFPEINARFAGDAIELLEAVNLGIATAVDDGLLVPVLSGADRLDLLSLAARARALADKAESGGFTSADLSGATFSVSNLGMFDVDSFSAVLNPPQAAILAVGSVKQRPVVRDGALAVGWTMSITLSCDHRVIDGARGGRFLADVKRRLENPAALLLPSGGASE
ncbi:2-oxo acid dehydrogenase subunit E2 [Candidatus Binatia bacterium]|nr:2-oxo acid dehydrogenase subunit E2 [Candidatus Binatia bacterium]